MAIVAQPTLASSVGMPASGRQATVTIGQEERVCWRLPELVSTCERLVFSRAANGSSEEK